MKQDVRWIQRMANLKVVVENLSAAMSIHQPEPLQRAGIVQYFEMAFELSWNTIKDYLESEGFEGVSSPRAALKKGFEQGLVEDGHGWMKGLEDRNLTSHPYNEDVAIEVEGLVRSKYLSLFRELIAVLERKLT